MSVDGERTQVPTPLGRRAFVGLVAGFARGQSLREDRLVEVSQWRRDPLQVGAVGEVAAGAVGSGERDPRAVRPEESARRVDHGDRRVGLLEVVRVERSEEVWKGA